ncbi:ABC transporter ATP-binding protein/permease [Thalassotalea sediminis]|uniref:ABC transporter ATP-binding protein/permease n=1 Tax=Thalassotalea sediminis TaxID=1759089 RepID=UPI00257391CF|nr:ABC transporter transmembrane domain-containing protein [Thalassotalea sediminis]
MNQPEASQIQALKGLKQYQAEYRQELVKLVLIKSSYFIAQIICFWLFAQMMHMLIVEQSSYSATQFNLFVVSAFCWLVGRHISQHKEISLDRKIKLNIERKVQKSLSEQQHALAQQHSSFQWQQIFLQHIPAVAAYISQYVTQKYLSVLVPILALVMVFAVNWFVALILIVTLPLVPVFMILVGHGAANIHRKHFISLERLGGIFIDRLKALTTITTFNQHHNQSQLLDTASNLVNKQTMNVVSVAFLSTTVLDFFATISMALVAVYIGFSLLGELSFGPEIVFSQGLFLLLLAPLLFSELKNLGRLYHQKAQAEAAWETLEPMFSSLSLQTKPVSSSEEFTGIDWLNFQVHNPKLTAPMLHIKPKQHIHLQGRSGAGKSVFLQALMGLTDASHQLTSKCVLLGQSPVILPSSVRENLSLGHPVSDDKLWHVLQGVSLDRVIHSLPQGIDTQLGEHPPLSGGELQRLMLARVLLQSAEVILLDEPTAHLPEEQHQKLSLLIYQLTKEKTVIWASHKRLPNEWFEQIWQITDGVINNKHIGQEKVQGVIADA